MRRRYLSSMLLALVAWEIAPAWSHAGTLSVSANDQTVFEGFGGSILWTIEDKTGKFYQITKITLGAPTFAGGERDDEVNSHTPGAMPTVPFTLGNKGDTANFKTNFTSQDLILDGNADTGRWYLDVFVDYKVDEGPNGAFVEDVSVGQITVTVKDAPEPATFTLAAISAIGLSGGVYRRCVRRRQTRGGTPSLTSA